MASVKGAFLFYTTLILLVFVSSHAENKVGNSLCVVETELNTIVNIKNTRAKSNSTQVLKGWNLENQSLCKEKCCDNPKCQVYVFYESAERPVNCFLIHCLPTSDCVRSRLNNSLVGVMKRNSIKPAGSVPNTPVHSTKLFTMSKEGVLLETTISHTPLDATESTNKQQLANREESSSNKTNVSTSIPSTLFTTHTTSITSSLTQSTPRTTTNNSATTENMSHNHTNKSSLVIALFFGILFVLAVIVIIGRPWWNFVQRPRYSKVDYLMNGL